MMSSFKIKGIYLLLYMAFAMWRVFYNIHLEDIGLNGSQIGTLNAIIQVSIFIVVMLWGTYADKKGIRPTLRIAVLFTAILMYLLIYINSFWVLVLFLPVITFFYHPLGALTDALAVQFASIEQKHSYGSFRLWGSLGWAIAAIIGGYAFTILPIKYILPTSAALFLMVIPFLSTKKKIRTYKANFQAIKLKDLLQNKPLVFFISILTLYGIVCAPVFSYLNLYFKELNTPNSIVGLAYGITAFSELPFFLIGNKLLKKMGAKKIMLLAMLSMVIRFLIYGLYPNVELALAAGLLQGVSLAFFLVGAVDYIIKLMPADQIATSQSLIWGSYLGIGQTLGNLLIGFLIDGFGMVGVMKIFIFVAIGCILATLLYFKRQKETVQFIQ